MDEVLFLSLVTYLLFSTALYYYLCSCIDKSVERLSWFKELFRELIRDKDFFGLLYMTIMIIMMLPTFIIAFFIHLTKMVFKRRNINGKR